MSQGPPVTHASETNTRLDLWHATWLGALMVGAGGLLVAPVSADAAALAAVGVMIAPAFAGLGVTQWRRVVGEPWIILGWGAGALVATLMTGAVASPLAAWYLTPLAAAAATGRPQRLALGAAVTLGCLGLAMLWTLALGAGASRAPTLSAALSGFAVLTTAAAFGAPLMSLQRGVDLGRRRTRASEALLREALNDQPHLLISIYPSGKLAAAWGQAPAALADQVKINRHLAQLAAPGERVKIELALERALQTGSSSLDFSPPSGGPARLQLHLHKGGSSRLMGSILDISAHYRQNLALEAARAEAEAQNAGKSRFLANMSHELRTPLNAIMGFSDILRQQLFGSLSDRYADYAQSIFESGEHLLELINDVLDMSKIEAERFELHREIFDARDALNAVLRLMRGQADRAGVQLRGLSPKDAVEVDADRRALKQIFLNLISNALKFTPKGGSVTVTLQADGSNLELIVADTGSGISPEDVARLGQPYEQTAEGARRADGTGLGLSLVRAFCRLHAGDMQIESRLGEGTSVIVRLPVVAAVQVLSPVAAGSAEF